MSKELLEAAEDLLQYLNRSNAGPINLREAQDLGMEFGKYALRLQVALDSTIGENSEYVRVANVDRAILRKTAGRLRYNLEKTLSYAIRVLEAEVETSTEGMT